MLPSAHRMRNSADFSSAVRHGRRVRRGTVVVHLSVTDVTAPPASPASPTSPGPRPALVGFVVGKSVGGSVIRHRVTRRLRAILAARVTALPMGSATVVRALPGSAQATSGELAVDVGAALDRLTSAVR